MAKKTIVKVNKKTRAVEKTPIPVPVPVQDLPKPEAIKPAPGIKSAEPLPDGSVGAAIKAGPASTGGVKLDLACGQTPREGYEGVDLLAPNAKYKMDLWKFPWSWADDSVDELHTSHFIEHIPCREVEERDIIVPRGLSDAKVEELKKEWLGRDMMFAFFDECWRILKHGGHLSVICPCGRSDRAFQDPTHRRFIVAPTFFYFNEPWRKANKLDHYRVQCNYDLKADPMIAVPQQCCQHHVESPTQARNASMQSFEYQHLWNTVTDWSATLTAVKTPPPA